MCVCACVCACARACVCVCVCVRVLVCEVLDAFCLSLECVLFYMYMFPVWYAQRGSALLVGSAVLTKPKVSCGD